MTKIIDDLAEALRSMLKVPGNCPGRRGYENVAGRATTILNRYDHLKGATKCDWCYKTPRKLYDISTCGTFLGIHSCNIEFHMLCKKCLNSVVECGD